MKAGSTHAALNPVSDRVLQIVDRSLQAAVPSKTAPPDVAAAAAEIRHDPELHDAVAELLTSQPSDPPRLAAALGMASRMTPAGSKTAGPSRELRNADPIRRIYTRCEVASDRADASDADNTARYLAALVLSAVVLEWTSLGTTNGQILRGRGSDPSNCGHLTAVLERRNKPTSTGQSEEGTGRHRLSVDMAMSQQTDDAAGFDLKLDPLTATTPAEYIEVLRQYRIWSGNPSWRAMAKRAGQAVVHSTMYAAMNGSTLPKLDVVKAIIIGCDGGEEDLRVFATAWRRVATVEGPKGHR
jgi:hypothetical protein